ncbi:tetratricopeptide repeat protein [Xylophilus sp. GW821-FHT01B05]
MADDTNWTLVQDAPAAATTTQGRVCPKCSYARQASDSAPAWQCPRCQVAYDKVLANAGTRRPSPRPAQAARPEAPGRGRWLVVLLALALAGGAGWKWWTTRPPSAQALAAQAEARARTAQIDNLNQQAAADTQLAQAETQVRQSRSPQALDTIRNFADQGNTRAMVLLASLHRSGAGLPKDHGLEMEWLRKAANEGSALAMVNLGYVYEKGLGEPQNYEQAADWYGKAARQGDGAGLLCLGALHAVGVPGAAKDPVRAAMLLDLAHREFTRSAGSNDSLVPDRKTPFWAFGILQTLQKTMSPVEIVKARELADAWQPGQPFGS